MIRFTLRCRDGAHEFEGWFRSGADYESQAERGLLGCPTCGSHGVEKALMRPAVATVSETVAPAAPVPASQALANKAPPELLQMMRQLQEMSRQVRAQSDYVGPRFAEEARRIHYGETEERRIYGEASGDEVRGLLDEGIGALPLPPLPEDAN